MKLVIMEHPTTIHMNSTWSCFRDNTGTPDECWEMQGHKVIEVDDELGSQILKDMKVSMLLQLQLRELCYPSDNENPEKSQEIQGTPVK